MYILKMTTIKALDARLKVVGRKTIKLFVNTLIRFIWFNFVMSFNIYLIYYCDCGFFK